MIGVYGGTFDPVHFGHLRTALDVFEQLQLERILVVPCRVPPHREPPAATPEARHAMLELALAGQSQLQLDTRELQRDGPSYMVDTLQSLRDEIGDRSLALILGQDAFLGLPGWHRWERLLDLAHLVVMTRPGWQPPEAGELAALLTARYADDARLLNDRPAGRIHCCTVTQLAISATDIRERLAAGLSGRYLLPQVVLDYIFFNGLYETGNRRD